MKEYNRSNELVRKHYDDALRIANSFSSKFLLQDDKEGIALLALIRASRTYKKEVITKKKKKVKVKFTTHLMNCVINSLKTSVNRSKRKGPIFQNRRVVKLDEVTEEKGLAKYELKFDDWDPYKLRLNHKPSEFQQVTFFDLLVDKDHGDPLIIKELLFLVRKRLTERQNKILDLYSNPENLRINLMKLDKQRCREIILEEDEINYFIEKRYANFNDFTCENVGKSLQCSRQRVHQQLRIIRKVFKKVQKDQGSESFKFTKEEREELYG